MDPHRRPNLPSRIQIGEYEVDTWYSGAYPEEYVRDDKILLICEFCLSYMLDEECLAKHNNKCRHFCPPANEIYRSLHNVNGPHELQPLSVYEVDGAKAKLYCQNLCFLGKLFIDQKTLCYDVDQFLFYVLTWNDDDGSHIIGYFSKEKHSKYKYNVSCIMVLPQYQGAGYGRFLIEFSYLLSKHENQLGSPEKPLSKLGLSSYMNYWKYCIIDVIKDKHEVTFRQISEATNMTIDDVKSALFGTKLARVGKDNQISIYLLKRDLEKLKQPRLRVKPEDLRWTRYVSFYAKKEDNDGDGDDEDEEEEDSAANVKHEIHQNHVGDTNGLPSSHEPTNAMDVAFDDEDNITVKSHASDSTVIATESPRECLVKLEPMSSCVDGY